MTSKIEKQFFETFEIPKIVVSDCYDYYIKGRKIDIYEKHCNEYLKNGGNCVDCTYKQYIEEYPQISDSILLELICLHDIYLWGIHPKTVDRLKNVLLEKYIEHVNLMADENEKQEYIQQVQALFKEDNE